MLDETWIAIDGMKYPYQVSSLGRVRRPAILIDGPRGPRQLQPSIRKLTTSSNPHGYRRVVVSLVCADSTKQTFLVSALVASAFIGERPLGQHVCHRDGDPTNNHATNLRYGTPTSNTLDAINHGTVGPNVAFNYAKLNLQQVLAIRAEDSTKKGWAAKLACAFGVSKQAVRAAKRGASFRGVS